MTSRAWDDVRAFGLGLPHAYEDFPWGKPVLKIGRPPDAGKPPMFCWLGSPDASPPAVGIKLTTLYDEAVTMSGAHPMTHSGLGNFGWLTVPISNIDLALVRDWIVESYCSVAPKQLATSLEALWRQQAADMD